MYSALQSSRFLSPCVHVVCRYLYACMLFICGVFSLLHFLLSPHAGSWESSRSRIISISKTDVGYTHAHWRFQAKVNKYKLLSLPACFYTVARPLLYKCLWFTMGNQLVLTFLVCAKVHVFECVSCSVVLWHRGGLDDVIVCAWLAQSKQ